MELAHQSLYSFSMHYSVLQSLYSLACITDTKPVSQQDTQLYVHASHDPHHLPWLSTLLFLVAVHDNTS